MFVGRALRSNHLPKVARSFIHRSTDASDPTVIMSSHMCVYKADSDATLALSMDWFVESALGYRLSGEPARCLCEHNASVASNLSRSQVAQTWRLLQLICATSVMTSNISHVTPAQPSIISSLPVPMSLQLTETGITSYNTGITTDGVVTFVTCFDILAGILQTISCFEYRNITANSKEVTENNLPVSCHSSVAEFL